MNRKLLIASLRIAGYHNDKATFTKLFCEHRISRKVADEAFAIGVSQKQNGMKCSCYQCKDKT